MKKNILLAFVLVVLVSGCVWFEDDDDDCNHCNEYREHIIYINHTDYAIDNYINDVYVGSCTPLSDLHVYGDGYEGYSMYFSACNGCDLEWGPTEFFVEQGGILRIILEYPPSANSRNGRMIREK